MRELHLRTLFKGAASLALCVFLFLSSSTAQSRQPFVKLLTGWDRDVKFINPGELLLVGRIALVAKIGGYDRIIAANLGTKDLAALIDGPGNNFSPALSPDGTRLAFVSDRDGNREIYVSDSDGHNQMRITQSPGLDDFPSWSPDGHKLVYSSEGTGKVIARGGSNLFAVVIIGQARSEPVQITFQKGKNSMPVWSPDGRFVAYTTDRFWPGFDICVVDLETKNELCPLQGKKSFFKPSWSKTGRSLQYLTGESGSTELGIMNLKDKTFNTLLESVVRPDSVVFLKDDKQFLFTSKIESKDTGTIYYKDIRIDKFSPLFKLPFPVTGLTWAEGIKEKEEPESATVDIEKQ